MSNTSTNLLVLDLPVKKLLTIDLDFPTITTQTSDNLPDYFGMDRLASITIPQGWNMHFDVITELRKNGHWQGVSELITNAVRLCEAGTEYAVAWNSVVEECFDSIRSSGKVVEMEMKEAVIVASWNDKMARLRLQLEKAYRFFMWKARSDKIESRVERSFDAHRNLGVDGDGKKWWLATVGALLKLAEDWIVAPFTLELWLGW